MVLEQAENYKINETGTFQNIKVKKARKIKILVFFKINK